MPLFRRGRPLHEQLARDAGIDLGSPPPHDSTPRWGEVGIHGVPRAREWDAVGTAVVHGVPRDEIRFVALPDRTLLLESDADVEDVALNAFADALALVPPYRAWAVRRAPGTWAVGARTIEVVSLPDAPGGAEQLQLSAHEGERSLLVDGARVFGGMRSLEALGAEYGDSWVVEAERLDGDLWEVRVTPL